MDAVLDLNKLNYFEVFEIRIVRQNYKQNNLLNYKLRKIRKILNLMTYIHKDMVLRKIFYSFFSPFYFLVGQAGFEPARLLFPCIPFRSLSNL